MAWEGYDDFKFGLERAGCAHFARRREAGWVFQLKHLFFVQVKHPVGMKSQKLRRGRGQFG